MHRLQLIGRLDRRYAAPLHDDGLAVIVDEDGLFRSSSQLDLELLYPFCAGARTGGFFGALRAALPLCARRPG
jgi:hypothetical protein